MFWGGIAEVPKNLQAGTLQMGQFFMLYKGAKRTAQSTTRSLIIAWPSGPRQECAFAPQEAPR